MKASTEKTATPILTAIDVETGMSMAVLVTDKQQQFKYLTHCLHNFLLECGRTHTILANTVLQSDQADFLMALLKATAASLGSNISVRRASAYSSQSQSSVERFHRTLMGQVRTLKTQMQNNYPAPDKPTPNHAMACPPRSVPAHKVRRPQQRQHKLLPQMAAGTQSTTLRVWGNSAVHGPNSKGANNSTTGRV